MFAKVYTEPAEGIQTLRRQVRSFIEKEVRDHGFQPFVNSWMVHDAAFTRRLAQAGFVGMVLPKSYGGHGRSTLERHVVSEELLAAGAPLAAHWIADRQSAPQILGNGSEALKAKLLPRIAAGECCFAIGMSEPDVGSDLASIRARAEKSATGWSLTGTKLWTTNAHNADYLIGLFRTSKEESRHAGLTQFVIDLRREGVSVSPIQTIAGDADFCEVSFDNYQADDGEVLGTVGMGWQMVMQELVLERSGPDRFLSTFALLSETMREAGLRPERLDTQELGALVVKLGALAGMSISVAAAISEKVPANVEAIIVKDLGTGFEQSIADVVRKVLGTRPRHGDSRLQELLSQSICYAPSFSLRGGTREILRGLIAREFGSRS